MIYRLLADLVVVVHLAFIVFVVAGGFIALRWPSVAWIHIPCFLWGAAIAIAGWICPLTPLENWLRRLQGGDGYPEGFVAHYIVPLVYPGALTRTMQVVLGLTVLAINIVAYTLVWIRYSGRA